MIKKFETVMIVALSVALLSSLVYATNNLVGNPAGMLKQKAGAIAAAITEPKQDDGLGEPSFLTTRVAAGEDGQESEDQKVEIITLNDKNSATMDQVYSDEAVQKVMLKLKAISDRLPKDGTIYLVLKSPGGSVESGLKLISFAKALPQKVKTLTIFAASMAFQTVQNLDERLILDNGTLMSHPASFGVEGQTPYQLYSRLRWIMSMIDHLDNTAAHRMGLSFKSYQDLIHDEYWTYDRNAVKDRAADRSVLARCGSYAKPTETTEVMTMFGTFEIETASCPLIPGIVSIKTPQNVSPAAAAYVRLMYTDRAVFTRSYIVNNKFMEFQK